MMREGRQHGVVRSYAIIPDSQKRYVKTVDSACVSGLFTKVSRKPTNQSKFTGKCGKAQCLGCHIHPVTKSKDKTKGTMKSRSIGSDHGRISCCPPGTSAELALAYLDRDLSYDDDDEKSDEYGYGNDDDDDTSCYVEGGIEVASFMVPNKDIEIEDKDECMSYWDVGLCWGEGGEDEFGDYDEWYLVGDTNY
ncbi:uncharacterized protein [Rutidosis leptorrhynchoides]|uniref:uncharacterized protein n=1 Tax=Rutidosis leptorrhynchoides TaxID=125765 RepID=UPI003A99960B